MFRSKGGWWRLVSTGVLTADLGLITCHWRGPSLLQRSPRPRSRFGPSQLEEETERAMSLAC